MGIKSRNYKDVVHFCLDTSEGVASLPGPAQLPIIYSTASDGKLGGVWERG